MSILQGFPGHSGCTRDLCVGILGDNHCPSSCYPIQDGYQEAYCQFGIIWDMLHICSRFHGQSFDETPFEEEILAFICFLRHSATIMTLTDVNINKLYHPWRSFDAIINKCLTGKSSSYDSLRLSQAQILWAKASKAKSLSALSENSTDDEGDADEGKDGDDDKEDDGDDGKDQDGDDDDEDDDGEEGDDDDANQEVKRNDDKDDEKEGNGEEDIGLNTGGEEGHVEEDDVDELYRDVNINQGRGIQANLEVEDSHATLTLVNPDGMKLIFETTSQMDVPTPTFVAPFPMTAPTTTPSTIATITTTSQAPILPTTVLSTAVKVAVQIQSDCLRDEVQRDNDEFLKTVDENMQKIIKEQVKELVKVQVSKILPRIEQAVNEQLETEVLTHSSHLSKTSYAVAADLSKMELKKILIEKMEGNKDDEMMILIRMKNTPLDQTKGQRDAEKERSLKEPMQTTSQMKEPSHPEFDTCAEDLPIVQSSQHPEWFSQQQKPPSSDRDWNKTVPTIHESIHPWISELAK
nr:hypothetical protein [Tanacetum cinerariifolium]